MIFESERLYFRMFVEEDAPELLELNSDPLVIKYTGDPPFKDFDEALKFVKEYDHYTKHGFGRWAVIRKVDHSFIGWCGLKYNEENEIDIGFRLFRKEWGNGYATEAVRATLNYGINELSMNIIVGRAAAENIASIKVLEKTGFKYQKTSPCHGIEDARYYIFRHA